jgi:hypothetical protein
MTDRKRLNAFLDAELVRMREEVDHLRHELQLRWKEEDKRRRGKKRVSGI